MAKRKYSDREKAEVLALLRANGGAVSRTAAETGIPERTVRHWANGERQHDEVAKLADSKTGELYDLLTETMYRVLKLAQDKEGDAAYSDLVRTFGIAFDKRQLLTGGATENAVIRVEIDDEADLYD